LSRQVVTISKDYVMRLETKDGKIIHYREYWNPVPFLIQPFKIFTCLFDAVMQERKGTEDRVCSHHVAILDDAEKITQAGAETVLLTASSRTGDLVEGATVKPVGSDDSQGLIEATQHAESLFDSAKLDTPSSRRYDVAGAKAVRENQTNRQHFQHWCSAKPNLVSAVSFIGNVEIDL